MAGEAESGAQPAGAPADVTQGALFLDGLLLSLRKASRLGLAGGSFGRSRSVREATEQLASAAQELQHNDASARDKAEKAYKRLAAEAEAAKRLRERAEEALASSEPAEGAGQALTAAAQAIFSHQGSRLEADLAGLKQCIAGAEAGLAQGGDALQGAGAVGVVLFLWCN